MTTQPEPFLPMKRGVSAALCVAALLLVLLPTTVSSAGTAPVASAAPYEYLGWGNPQPPASVLKATGIHDLTMAFVLAHKGCHPEWDGTRPLLGGKDEAAIESVRKAGGDVDVSFGGWSGPKLGIACTTATALAGAYQAVINDYNLSAIDIDIEHTEVTEAPVRERVIEALAELQQQDPTLEISVTFDTGESGPDSNGQSMITQAAGLGFLPYAWTVMPFDFGGPVKNMAKASISAAKGLEADIASAYGLSSSDAYAHVGISSMNGDTDDSGETVSLANFKKILAFAESEHIARLSFWAVNRDRQCGGKNSSTGNNCSGITQSPYAFTDLLAQFN